MGAWFFATAGGNFVAGKIGEMTGGESGTMSKEGTLEIYWTIGLVAMGIGVAVVLVGFLIKRLMHLDTLRDDDELAGYKELADENQGAGLFPQRETKPGTETI
jgi:proton-dependent oligopeptide transporter, POT family